MSAALVITFICIMLLSQYSDGATPQRERLTNLEYVYRYGTSRPTDPQTFYQINNIVQQQDSSLTSNAIDSHANEKGVHYNEDQLLLKPRRPYWTSGYRRTPSYNVGAEQKYEVYQNTQPTTHQPSYGGAHSKRHPQSTHISQIIYAPRAKNSNELQPPPLVNPFPGNAPNRNTQQKIHSNQKKYAPKRPHDINVSKHTQLPYPPSFISITSSTSTTTAAPTESAQSGAEEVTSLTRLPDIFAARQHKSLLDSYIPSWVLIRMLQQQKLMQNKQLHQFVATHTLAFPVTKKAA